VKSLIELWQEVTGNCFRFLLHLNFGLQLTWVLLQVGLDGSTISSCTPLGFSSWLDE
jgi:hypothetical protein